MYEKVIATISAKLQDGVNKGNMIAVNKYVNELIQLAIRCKNERNSEIHDVLTKLQEWIDTLTTLDFPSANLTVWRAKMEEITK